MSGIFITGTDTGVGKTIVTATLCRILCNRGIDAVAIKPFATGISPATHWRDNDPLLLSAAMNYAESPEVISPVRLEHALSPYDAARLSGGPLDIDEVYEAVEKVAARHAFAIIEGVGGVCVPLTADVMVKDFARRLDVPALVVGRSAIGTINHSLLTIGALREAGVRVCGLMFSRFADGELSLAEQAGTETAACFSGVDCLGLVQYSGLLAAANDVTEFVSALPTGDPTLMAFADYLETIVI